VDALVVAERRAAGDCAQDAVPQSLVPDVDVRTDCRREYRGRCLDLLLLQSTTEMWDYGIAL